MTLARLILLALTLFLPANLYLLPKGGKAVHTQANFSQEGKALKIQVEDNAILEFDTFNIEKDERVEFLQRTIHSRVLSRVLGGDVSHIQGSLRANGNLYLINPAGIYFGKDAVVEVGGLYAAAGKLSNHDFLADKKWFTGLANRLINEGFIQGQMVHLIGQKVINKGSIVAPEGVIALVAAQSVLIGQREGHVFFELHKPEKNSLEGGVEQEGSLLALEGQIFLGAADIYAVSLKNTSHVQAKELEIYSEKAQVKIGGRVEANQLKIISPEGVKISGEVRVFDKASLYIDKPLQVSGLLLVSGGELSIDTLLHQKITLGDHKNSLFKSEDAKHLEVKLLKVGSENIQSLSLAPFKKGALDKVQHLHLQAAHEKGSLLIKKNATALPSLSLHAKKSIESQGSLSSRGNIEILGDLSLGSQTRLELNKGDLSTPKSIYLQSGGKLLSIEPLTINAGQDLVLENVAVESLSEPSLFTAKNTLQVRGQVMVSAGAKFEVKNASKQASFVVNKESALISPFSKLSIEARDLQLEGEVEAPSLQVTSTQPIVIGLEQDNSLSISPEELAFFQVDKLELGDEKVASIRVFSLPVTPIEKYVLHARQVDLIGNSLSFPNLSVQALEKIALQSRDFQVGNELSLNAPIVLLKGKLAMGQLAHITAKDKAVLTGSIEAKDLSIQGKEIHFEKLSLTLEKEGSLLVGEKEGLWVEQLWVDEESSLKTKREGRIDLLANEVASVYGEIEAKGGRVEVSSKGLLDFQAKVNLEGKKRGQLWLDPEEFIIGYGSNTSNRSYLTPKQLLSLLENADVLLEAQQRLYLQVPLEDLKGAYQQLTLLSQGEIYLQAPVKLSASLHLQAKEAIYLQASIQLTQDLYFQAPQVFSLPGYQVKASSIYLDSLHAGTQQTPLAVELEKLRQLPKESFFLASLQGEEQQAFHKTHFPQAAYTPETVQRIKKEKVKKSLPKKKGHRLGAYDSMALRLQGEKGLEGPKTSIERLLKKLKP